MSEEKPFYTPNLRPATTRVPVEGEHVWSLHRNAERYDAQLRFHGDTYGWEAQLLRDGELIIGQRFLLREQAIAWMAAENEQLRRYGWRPQH